MSNRVISVTKINSSNNSQGLSSAAETNRVLRSTKTTPSPLPPQPLNNLRWYARCVFDVRALRDSVWTFEARGKLSRCGFGGECIKETTMVECRRQSNWLGWQSVESWLVNNVSFDILCNVKFTHTTTHRHSQDIFVMQDAVPKMQSSWLWHMCRKHTICWRFEYTHRTIEMPHLTPLFQDVSWTPKIAITFAKCLIVLPKTIPPSPSPSLYLATDFVLEYKWVYASWRWIIPLAPERHPVGPSTMYNYTHRHIKQTYEYPFENEAQRRKHIPFFTLPPNGVGCRLTAATKPLMNKPICAWLTSIFHP